MKLQRQARAGGSGATRLSYLLVGACFAALLYPAANLRAQAKIDPTLPPEPLIHKRSLVLFPGYDTVADPDISIPPLTPRQKWQTFMGRTFDFSMPVEAAMFAGMSQAVNYTPHYGTNGDAYFERMGAYAGSLTGSSLFGDFLFPVAFHQDPRYLRKGHGSFGSRMRYVITREVVTHRDNGTETFNSSGLLGLACATGVSNAYYPRSGLTLASNMERLGLKVGISTILNIVREFVVKTPGQ